LRRFADAGQLIVLIAINAGVKPDHPNQEFAEETHIICLAFAREKSRSMSIGFPLERDQRLVSIRYEVLRARISKIGVDGFASKKNLESIGVRDGMGGQGQYRVGRGSIGWAGAVSTVPLPKSEFRHTEKAL